MWLLSELLVYFQYFCFLEVCFLLYDRNQRYAKGLDVLLLFLLFVMCLSDNIKILGVLQLIGSS